ncbi:MAG: hypothetical protein ACT4QE_06365 [Anaerolineales bacterium]
MTDFDSLWNYDNPVGAERQFRAPATGSARSSAGPITMRATTQKRWRE